MFWITIVGPNIPSKLLDALFIDTLCRRCARRHVLHSPWWLTGFLVDVFIWPPPGSSVDAAAMAIFFPMFTLWRISDTCRGWLSSSIVYQKIRRARQTGHDHDDGFWLQRGGVVATLSLTVARTIDAILTNNFALCTAVATQILVASLFWAALAAHLAG
jgi:hypothetical protein